MFQIGDVVRLRTGEQPIVITEVDESNFSIKGFYLSPSVMETWHRDCGDYIHYENSLDDHYVERWELLSKQHSEVPEPQGETIMTTLYQTNEKKPRFGTKLATNSEGKVVLEIKGTGEVEAFKPEDITEVVPYTVSVEFLEGSNSYNRSQNYSYITTEGAVSTGDIIFVEPSGNMARVTKVNTKSRKATKELKGRKVATTEI